MLHAERCLVVALPALLALVSGCGGRSAPGQSDGAVHGDANLPDGGLLACATLDLPSCRQRADCAPDLCFACSCTPSFEGCRLATAPAFQCPELECAQPLCCQEASECMAMGGDCTPPDAPAGCGMCNPDPGDCGMDGECSQGSICSPVPCSCSGASLCVPGCVQPADCAQGTTCSGGGHPRCLPSACSASAPCPPDFDCDEGTCARRGCTSDLQCDHFCVASHCFDAYGVCLQAVP